MLVRTWRKGNPCALLVGLQIGAATMVWGFLKEVKMELLDDLEISLLGIYPKKIQNTNFKRYMHPYVHCSIIYNSQDMEDKKVVVHIQWNITRP